MLFALAAEEARLEVVALLSGWNPHPSHPSLATREHWIANNLYRWMPTVDVIHVNPGVFAFLYLLGLPAIVHLGLLALPFGDGLNAPPSNEDIGRVAAGVLADPASHVGRSYRPTGPELISAETVAEILSTQLGRRVRYQDVSFKMFTKAARASGFPIFDISQIRYYAEEIREGAFAMGAPTEHVLEVTGRAPESFSEIARRYLAQPSLIHPLVSAGTKPGALLFAFRMLLTPAWDVEAWERDRGFATISRPELAHENEAWRSAAARHSLLLEEPVR
jgi:hypothetical protein